MVKNIPEDINIEDLLLYLPNDTYQIALNGHHKRNAYYDIVNIEENGDKILFEVGRNSLYNSLPEILNMVLKRLKVLFTSFSSLTYRLALARVFIPLSAQEYATFSTYLILVFPMEIQYSSKVKITSTGIPR